MKKYKKNPLKFLWFYKFDIGLICLMSINIFLYLILILFPFCGGGYPVGLDDIKKYYLRKINGFNICDFELPLEFDKLNNKDKIKIIFKNENMKKYEYKLDVAQ